RLVCPTYDLYEISYNRVGMLAFFFQAEDGIRDRNVTGVQTCALPISIAPAYGGINLEDIAAPRCFEIERRLRDELDIPVFHDDQHGTGVVTLAALKNALKVVGKRIED